MRAELNQRLRENYPKIFSNHCEISCNDGWFNILNSLCGCIQNHIDWSAKNYETSQQFNTMAEALVAGDDTLFLEYFSNMTPEFLQARREDILAGQRRLAPEPVTQVTAQQVKEKFGTLRFYVTGGDSEIHGMIQMAETMSAVTCEDCGSPGTTVAGGWVQTLCAQHRLEKADDQ
jgi:hypothetical protein